MHLQDLMYISYKGKNWMYNPKIPMIMQRSTHVLGRSSLENASFFNLQVLFPLLWNVSLQTHTFFENICTFSVLVYLSGVSGNPGLF